MRGRAVAARPLLVNGAVGVVVAPRGHLMMILDFTIRDGKVLAIEAITEPGRVAALDLAILAAQDTGPEYVECGTIINGLWRD
jgi:RNA polymerase sigma-70 factor (ECF subfamily)